LYANIPGIDDDEPTAGPAGVNDADSDDDNEDDEDYVPSNDSDNDSDTNDIMMKAAQRTTRKMKRVMMTPIAMMMTAKMESTETSRQMKSQERMHRQTKPQRCKTKSKPQEWEPQEWKLQEWKTRIKMSTQKKLKMMIKHQNGLTVT
jgi:hypothetical protein